MNRGMLIFWLIATTLFVSCTRNIEVEQEKTPEKLVTERAEQVVSALQARDMNRIAQLIHPTKGVRFSPYAYVRDQDLRFTADILVGLLEERKKYHWGEQDGSGEPLLMTFKEYYEGFIYDRDYAHAEKQSLNERIGGGNSPDNSREYYPDSMVVEYYFSGSDPRYEGMDWSSLRLVFEENRTQWYIVGVIHDEWTI